MGISASFEGVTKFLQDNDGLIAAVKSTKKTDVGAVKALADKAEENRKQTSDLVEQLGNLKFAVAPAADVRAHQRDLLENIARTRAEIDEFADNPALVGILQANLVPLYAEMANTYLGSVSRIVVFAKDEVDALRAMLRQATLDADARQRWADVLDAAVQVSKATLALAVKLAA